MSTDNYNSNTPDNSPDSHDLTGPSADSLETTETGSTRSELRSDLEQTVESDDANAPEDPAEESEDREPPADATEPPPGERQVQVASQANELGAVKDGPGGNGPDDGSGTDSGDESTNDTDTPTESNPGRTITRDVVSEVLSTGPGSAAAGVSLKQAAETAGVAEAADAVSPFLSPGVQGAAELAKQPPGVVKEVAKETAADAARDYVAAPVAAAAEAAGLHESPGATAGRPDYAVVSTELPGDGETDTVGKLSVDIRTGSDAATGPTDSVAAAADASANHDPATDLGDLPAMTEHLPPIGEDSSEFAEIDDHNHR